MIDQRTTCRAEASIDRIITRVVLGLCALMLVGIAAGVARAWGV